jgi:hypothetical protein
MFTALVSAARVDPKQVAICGEASEENNYTHAHTYVHVHVYVYVYTWVAGGAAEWGVVGGDRKERRKICPNLKRYTRAVGRLSLKTVQGISVFLSLSLSL